MWRRLLLNFWLLFCCSVALPRISFAQQDVNVGGYGPYFDLGRGLKWGVSGAGGVNNNFTFTPTTPDSAMCVYIKNNNPTSAHSVTIVVSQTGDSRQTVFTGQPQGWLIGTTVGALSPLASLTTKATLFRGYAAARIAISLSASIGQTGTPDTADVFAVATTSGACGPINGGIPSVNIDTPWNLILDPIGNQLLNMRSYTSHWDFTNGNHFNWDLFGNYSIEGSASISHGTDIQTIANHRETPSSHNNGFVGPGATLDLETTDADVTAGDFGSLIAHNTFISAQAKTDINGGVNRANKGIIASELQLDSNASGFSDPPPAALFTVFATGSHTATMFGVSPQINIPDFNIALAGGSSCALALSENGKCEVNGLSTGNFIHFQNSTKPVNFTILDMVQVATSNNAASHFFGQVFPNHPLPNVSGLDFTDLELGDLWATSRALGLTRGLHIHAVESNGNSGATAVASGIAIDLVDTNTSAASVAGIRIGSVTGVNSSNPIGIEITALTGDSGPGSTITGIHIGPNTGTGTFNAIDVAAGNRVLFPGGSANTVMCWKADGRTPGFATVAEITAGTCH